MKRTKAKPQRTLPSAGKAAEPGATGAGIAAEPDHQTKARTVITYTAGLLFHGHASVVISAVLISHVRSNILWRTAGYESLDDCLQKAFGLSTEDRMYRERIEQGNQLWKHEAVEVGRWLADIEAGTFVFDSKAIREVARSARAKHEELKEAKKPRAIEPPTAPTPTPTVAPTPPMPPPPYNAGVKLNPSEKFETLVSELRALIETHGIDDDIAADVKGLWSLVQQRYGKAKPNGAPVPPSPFADSMGAHRA